MKHVDFVEDITPLLPADINYDIKDAFSLIIQQIVSRIDSELPSRVRSLFGILPRYFVCSFAFARWSG